jgi:mannosyl-3-phosphoglycerate phosphatase
MRLIIFSDLDATLLDAHTYSWAPATEALMKLRAIGALLVLVSSKTFAEMRIIHREMGLIAPFVVENGGGAAIREDDDGNPTDRLSALLAPPIRKEGYLLFPLGSDYPALVRTLDAMGRETGCRPVGFSAMTAAEISSLTGLSLEEAARARDRAFDEPFLLPPGSERREHEMIRAARRRGLDVVRGGRFLHLIGHGGKGKAVAALLDAYRESYGPLVTVGLGDSPNDFSFLELMDIPVLVGAAGGPPDVPESLAHARRVATPGPVGWNTAILDIISALNSRGSPCR